MLLFGLMLLHCLPCILLQSSLVGVVQWGNAPKSLYLCLSINRKSTYQKKMMEGLSHVGTLIGGET